VDHVLIFYIFCATFDFGLYLDIYITKFPSKAKKIIAIDEDGTI
jgi:hypothetical protein